MFTAKFIKDILDFLAFPLAFRNICVFMSPIFSTIQVISTYLLTKEATNRPDAGFLAALFMAVNTAIISRGVAGSYDNEAVAIWALQNTFYLWIKSVNTGSIKWSVLCTLSYFYMVASWGGYSFIINLIPVFVCGTIFIGKFNKKIYIAYSIFYTLGTVLSLLIVFVNYQVMRSTEHLASHLTFVLINVYMVLDFIRNQLDD
jgi:dolichyl-diphosphooligosaccharide--protein glycosyltransferase